MHIRRYMEDYIKYYPEKWHWNLKNDFAQSDLFLKTRARRSKNYSNCDLMPDFYSIERDAAQFGRSHVVWTDFFGLIWEGKKGVFEYAGAPDYEGSLYYYNPDNDYADEDGYCISDEYNSYKNQPPEDIYTKVSERGVVNWIDTANVTVARYNYIVDNHLFKDTYIELLYEDGNSLRVFDDYEEVISDLVKHGKEEIVNAIMKSMNEHFIKLRDSDREEVRAFYPGKTAEDMFLK